MSAVNRPDFLVTYTAIEVPAPILSMDATDPKVVQTTDAFFGEVIDSLDLSPRTRGEFFEIAWKTLTPMYQDEVPEGERIRGTDDYIQSFRRKGHQALASVLYMRDDMNHQVAHFAKYDLEASTIAFIRDLQHLERIEVGLE